MTTPELDDLGEKQAKAASSRIDERDIARPDGIKIRGKMAGGDDVINRHPEGFQRI